MGGEKFGGYSMSDKKQKFADLLGIDVKEFEKPEETTDKRVADLETAMGILLSGEVNDGE